MINEKGKIDLSLIIGIVLLLAIVISVLEIVGAINIRALFGGPGTFIPVNYEEKVKGLCDKVDDKGFYNQELVKKVSSELKEFTESPEVQNVKEENLDPVLDKLWEIVKQTNNCANYNCMLASKDNDRMLYYYDCKKDEFTKESVDERIAIIVKDNRLFKGCLLMNKNGVYEGNEVKCSNYYCSTTFRGKTYKKNCKTGEEG